MELKFDKETIDFRLKELKSIFRDLEDEELRLEEKIDSYTQEQRSLDQISHIDECIEIEQKEIDNWHSWDHYSPAYLIKQILECKERIIELKSKRDEEIKIVIEERSSGWRDEY